MMIGPGGSARYNVDFSPLARGIAGLGQGIGQGLHQQQQKKQQQAAEEARRQALVSGRQAIGSGDPNAVMDFVMQNPQMANDPAFNAILGMTPKSGERKILKDADGRQRYADTGDYVFDMPERTPELEYVNMLSPDQKNYQTVVKGGEEFEQLRTSGWDLTGDAKPASKTTYEKLLDAGHLPAGTSFEDFAAMTKAKTDIQVNAGQEAELPKPQPGYQWKQEDSQWVQTPIKGGPADKYSEIQGKAATFADRLLNVDSVLNSLGADGQPVDMQGSYAGPAALNRGAESLPGALGDFALGAANYVLSEDYQKFEQAKRDFTNAVLRRESGAVISPAEEENADKQYFPQPGDGPEVIEQKRQNRRAAMLGMIRDAGPRYAEELRERYSLPEGGGAQAAEMPLPPQGQVEVGMPQEVPGMPNQDPGVAGPARAIFSSGGETPADLAQQMATADAATYEQLKQRVRSLPADQQQVVFDMLTQLKSQ